MTALWQRLPAWLGTIRWRLALVYSSVVFGLTALVLAGVYWGVSRSTSDEPVSRSVQIRSVEREASADGTRVETRATRLDLARFENEVNERTLARLRLYSLSALGGLFLASLLLGWLLAGRALRPARRIAAVAHEIEATDLSRRIALSGPRDELRELAETFDGMLDRLERAVTHERQLVHELSHELRNPLAILRANLDVALANPDASPEELRRAVAVAERASERLATLVDDLFAWARREAPALRRDRIDIAELVRESIEEHRAAARARLVDLVAALDTAPSISGDRVALRRALANLLDNAIAHAPPHTAVTVGTGTVGGAAVVSITDDGPGVPDAHRADVFARTWRTPDSATDHQGSGLGLALARQIAEAHGGSLTLDATVDRGATFTIALPAQ